MQNIFIINIVKVYKFIKLMDINENIDLLNTFFIFKRSSISQRIEIVNIAKVSKNFDELNENLNWDYKYKNIK